MSYYEDPQPSGSHEMQGPSDNFYTTKWETNDPIDVDAYQPVQTESLPIITKVESMSEQTESTDKVFTHVCNALGVPCFARTLQAIKEHVRKKFKPPLLQHPNLKTPQAAWCKAIFVSGLPVWFEFDHVKTLIQLRSDFDVNWGSYYIDMFKNVNNENTGECLIRFMENKDCIQVFKDLQGLSLNGPLVINLDLGHDIAKVRDTYHPNFLAQLQNNESGQNIVVKTERDEDYVTPRTIDFNKYADIKPEISDNNDVSIKREREDTSEITKEGGVADMDIEENAENPSSGTAPAQEKQKESTPFLENYRKCLYQKCRIVHLKNLDTAKSNFFYPTLKDFIEKTINSSVNFQFKKVYNDKCGLSGDVLLQFTKHRDADVICRTINSGKDKDLHYITSARAPIEAIMGIGYEFKSKITTQDLRCFELKRKLEYEGKDESLNPKKPKRDTPTSTDNDSSNKGEGTTSETLEVRTEQRASTERHKESTSREKSSRSETTETSRRSHESPATNGESTSREKTKRVRTEYPTAVVTVDERDFTAFGLSKEFLQSFGLKVPFSRSVTVTNLHPDVDEAKLMEVFSLAGEVKKIDCHPTYRQAKIEFDHALEAVQAVSMLDRQKLYDKQLAVRMDELPRKRTLPQGLAGVGQGLGKHGQALRGCRIFAELRRLYEIFTDLGRAEKERNDTSNPFKFRFELIKPKNVKADSKSDKNRETIVVRDSSPEPTFSRTYDLRKKPSTSSASRSSTPNSSKASESSKDAKKSSKAEESIPEAEGTLLAIQALGTVLVAQGLIPADTDCKSLQSILGALQKKTAAQQNLQNLNIGQAQVLNHALSTVMQYMTTNPANAQNVQPVPVPAPVQPIPTPVQPIPAPVQPIPAPVQPIPTPIQPIPAPVPPVRPENQSKWDIVGRQFPVLITPPTLVGQRMPATNPAPVPVRPQPRVSFPIQPRPTAPQRSVQPAYDNIRSNLRAVPTGAPVATQPVRPPAPKPTSKPTPSQQKPEPVRDSTKEKDASQTKAALEKDSSQNKESFSKSEMLVFKDLPSCVTTEILQGKMREVGEVKFCEMTGRGRAFVRFKNPTDADRCIRLFHRSKVDGQIIQVSYL